MTDRQCEHCGDSLGNRHRHTRFCFPCAAKRNAASRVASFAKANEVANVEGAYRVLRAAVKYGFLPKPALLQCVDCGKPAECYDHRDYTKPLEVDAVCIGCNTRRGPAKDLMAARTKGTVSQATFV